MELHLSCRNKFDHLMAGLRNMCKTRATNCRLKISSLLIVRIATLNVNMHSK